MSTYQTLVQAALLINNEIVRGVAEDYISINPMFNFMPFIGYDGQAIVVNRELTLGGVMHNAVGGLITPTAKTAATFSQRTFTAVRLIADAQMDGLVQAQSTSAGVDQTAVEIASKAKNLSRTFQQGMATGTGTSPQMNSLHSMVDAVNQYTTDPATGTTGQAISFTLLDELLDLVKTKDGECDWMQMPARTLRSLKALYRGLGGIMPTQVIAMPNGTNRTMYLYEDIPVFKNEYLSVAETAQGAALTGGALTSVWAGVWDDGSEKIGLSGIHPASTPAGIDIHPVGHMENYDQEIWRLKQYANIALFNRKGLARLPSINN